MRSKYIGFQLYTANLIPGTLQFALFLSEQSQNIGLQTCRTKEILRTCLLHTKS